MNTMKLLGVLLLAISFTKCASAKFENKPPFTVTNATYNNVNNEYTEVRINVSKEETVNFKELYFQGRKTKVMLENNGNTVVAKFKKKITRLNDLELHGDPKKEFGNTVPQKQPNNNDMQLHGDPKKEFGNTPKKVEASFKLKENEAVLSYLQAGEIKYFKINNIRKTTL